MLLLFTSLQSIGFHFLLLVGTILVGRSVAKKLFKTYNFDPMRTRFPAFYIGLAWSFGLMIYAFNITTTSYEETYTVLDLGPDILDLEVTNKRTKAQEIVKKVKVLPPVIDSILFVEDDNIDSIVQKVEMVVVSDATVVDTFVSTPLLVDKTSVPLPPPLPQPPANDDPFVVVEEMPRFPGCEETDLSRDAKTDCANKELMAYVLSTVKYPTIARENQIEGYVIAQFVVDKKGNISDIEIKRDIGGGCGQAVAKVLNSMNADKGAWRPGRQQGRPVKVLFTLPIKFNLK